LVIDVRIARVQLVRLPELAQTPPQLPLRGQGISQILKRLGPLSLGGIVSGTPRQARNNQKNRQQGKQPILNENTHIGITPFNATGMMM
jgi:hypothetical protein